MAIGWFGPADPAHPVHGDLWTAALLAIEEANHQGGWNGVPLELLPRWSENAWGSGVSEVARMVYEDGVWAILGSVDGASTHLAEQIVAKARLPLVSPVSTDESVNLAGVPWMFSLAPADNQWTRPLVGELIEEVGEGSFALVTVTDHDSRLATRALLDELARADRVPSLRLDLRPGASDLEAHLERIDLGGQAALLLAAGPEEGARLLEAVRAAGFEGAVFGSPRFARRRCLEAAGKAAEGLRVPELGAGLTSADEARRFEELFRERAGSEPDWAARHAYDATRILVRAIRAAGLSRAGIREALAELSGWRGLTGPVEWDATGQNRRPVSGLATVRDGRLVVR